MKNKVSVTRKTTESKINIIIKKDLIKPDYREKINTPLPFLNHMIEHIVWRSGLNIEVDIKLDKFDLSHVVCEDIGQALGVAVAEFVEQNIPTGYGDAIGIIDEAKTQAAFSFENRSYFSFTSAVDIPVTVEGMLSEDLQTFLDGFVQGARCSLHVDVEKGENAHHIWEASFRAVGSALARALSCDENRSGQTSGVAGKISYEIK